MVEGVQKSSQSSVMINNNGICHYQAWSGVLKSYRSYVCNMKQQLDKVIYPKYYKIQMIHYLENKVGVVDFTKARGLVKFQSPRALAGPWALKHYHSLGNCKIYYSHFIFEVMYHSLCRPLA